MANGIPVTIEVLHDEVSKKLDDMLDASGNVTPAMQVIGRKIKTKVQLGFRTGTDPWGNPWKPLSPLTDLGARMPLRKTGHLLSSITAQVDGDSVEIGTNLQSKGIKFPAVQQFGAVIKPVDAKLLRWMHAGGFPVFAKEVVIPARPFLPISKAGATDLPGQWALDVLNALQAHFEKAAKA